MVAKKSSRSPSSLPPVTTSVATAARLQQLMQVIAKRRCEALTLYTPLDYLEDFHGDSSPERLVFGSNRAGKTLATMSEVARAVTGRDPHNKYPKTDGRCYIVAFTEKELGEVIYPKLFRAGAFRMIEDPVTGDFRPVLPKDPYDSANRHKWKPAPPLIPPRFIASMSWKSKAKNVPAKFVLKNGWELSFFTSLGMPVTGADVDLVVFDEEIENDAWYPEMAARLVDRRGKFIWGATPQAATERLVDLYKRSQKLKGAKVRSYFCSVFKNIYLPPEGLEELLEKFQEGSQEYEVRVEGKFAIMAFRIFPEFDISSVHGVNPFPVPHEWTRVAVIDPGHQVTAVLFAAVEPANQEAKKRYETIHLYDELYVKNCDAGKFAEAMQSKCAGQNFEDFIIDRQMSRQTEVASGLNVEDQYAEALRERGIKCNRRGNGFTWGSSDVHGGIEAVHKALRIRQDGTTHVVVHRERLPNFQDEIDRYRYKMGPRKERTNEPEKREIHLMDCFRMLMHYEPRWVKPRPPPILENAVLKALAAKKARLRAANKKPGAGYVRLGPGSPA
jgi:hypothetical protein